ncbi:MAG TPA: discoidin domain-containing protein [Kofleriaceae bacterium]|nr:discoidin domain-containing protein [Kofleriaceae bacterium]
MTRTAFLLPFLMACMVGEGIEGDHLDDYESPVTIAASPGCVPLGISEVTASGDDGHVADNAIDHDPSTRWSNLGKGSWIKVDLGEVRTLCSAGVTWFRGNERRANFTITTSADGVSFTAPSSFTSTGTMLDPEVYDLGQASARFVRITVNGNTDNDWASISELDIGGVKISGGGSGSGASSGQLDANGVKMMLPTDPARVSWWMGDPNNDNRFQIDGSGAKAVKQADGSYLFKPRKGGLSSGGTQLTLRLHVIGTTANESFTSHAQLRSRGHMTNDPEHELGDQEMTGYFRLDSITSDIDTLTKKIRGGRHTSGSAAKFAACVGLLLRYDGQGNQLFEKELFHPDTPKRAVSKLFSYGDAIAKGKWIGDKITSVRRPDGSVVNTQYIDLDPFDANGHPKNNWVKVFEYVDKGENVVNWSGKTSTWRIDEANKVYGKLLSVRSVKAQ